MKRIFLIFIFFLALSSSGFSKIYKSVQDGNWFDSDTWGGTTSGYPGKNDTAIISSGTTVYGYDRVLFFTFPVDLEVAKLIIEKDGKLSVYGSNLLSTPSTLTVYDSLIVDGILEGDGDQNSSGNVTNMFNIYMNGDVITGTGLIKYSGLYIENSTVKVAPDANLSLYLTYIVIDDDNTLDNYGKLTVEQWINGTNSGSTWINEENSFLAVGGDFMQTGNLYAYADGNTIRYDGLFGNFEVKTPIYNKYYNLILASLATGQMQDSLIILNDLTISSGALDPQGQQIRIYGNWYQYGNFLSDDSRVIFCGSKDQKIISSSEAKFSTLYLINAPYSIIDSMDIHVTDTLKLNSTVYLSSHNFFLGRNADTLGYLDYIGGKVLGRFCRWINSSSDAFLYPIGTEDLNTFVTVNFPTVDTAGVVGFTFISQYPGNDTLPISDNTGLKVYNVFGDGYWVADTSENFYLGNNTYNIALEGNQFTAFTINDSTRIVYRPATDSVWRFTGTQGLNDPDNYIVKRDNCTQFPGEFAFADTTNCTAPLLTDINGPVNVCRGETGVIYITDTSSTWTYNWTIDGGVISDNKGDTVAIDWDNNGEIGSITVQAQNSCTFGNSITKQIFINSVPPSDIYGLKAVPENTDSLIYVIDTLPDYTYKWYTSASASVDSVAPTQDTAWISFTTAGYDTIYVVASYNGGCNSDTAAFPIYVYEVINSIKSGNWHDPSVWDCNCIPQYNDNVKINSGHSIKVDLYYDGKLYTYENFVKNLFVEYGGNLTVDVDNDVELYVNGDLWNNGTINYDSQFQILNSNLILGGQGVINTKELDVAGSRQIESGSNLVVNGNVNIGDNLLQNNGGFIINGNLVANSSGTFQNGQNAYLFVSDSLLVDNGNLISDATGNTVEYGGSINQAIKPQASSSTGYYNLVLSGNGDKSLSGDITILGDLQIVDTATFDLNGHNVTIDGDWYDYSVASDPLVEGTQMVLFNGVGDQHIYTPYIETFYKLKIGQNSNLVVPPKQFLNINDTLFVDGQITLQFNSFSDTLPSIIYQKNPVYGSTGKINTTLLMAGKTWYEISPAIVGTTSDEFTLANGKFNPNLYWYDESVDLDGNSSTEPDGDYNPDLLSAGWKFVDNQNDGVNYPLKLNCGYMFYDETTDTIIMSGKVAEVTVDYDTTLSYTPNDPDDDNDTLPDLYDGWNIIGNPYIAYLSIDSIVKNSTGVDNGIYIWDNDNGQYAGYQNGYRVLSGQLGPYIPPLQGFAMRANSSGATVKIRPEYRVNAHQKFLKAAKVNEYKKNAIKLAFSANGRTEYFVTYFYKDASIGFNPKYDMLHLSTSLKNYPENPLIYTKLSSGIDLALNALPDSIMNSSVIPVYVKTGYAGTYTLSVPYINGLQDQVVLLKDLKTNKYTRLVSGSTYKFDYQPDDDPHRFDLLVIKDNPPEIAQNIVEQKAYEDSLFTLDLTKYFKDIDWFDSLTYAVNTDGNTWLRLENGKLIGTPEQKNVGDYKITVTVYDILKKSVSQTFELQVINTNDPPQLVTPISELTAKVGEEFIYQVPKNTFVDIDPGDSLTYFVTDKPKWLSFYPNTKILKGVPTSEDIGTSYVVLGVHDLAGAFATDKVKIKVLPNPVYSNKAFDVYPNPVIDNLHIFVNDGAVDQIKVQIYGFDGRLYIQKQLPGYSGTVDVSRLSTGLYVMKLVVGQKVYTVKFSKE